MESLTGTDNLHDSESADSSVNLYRYLTYIQVLCEFKFMHTYCVTIKMQKKPVIPYHLCRRQLNSKYVLALV